MGKEGGIHPAPHQPSHMVWVLFRVHTASTSRRRRGYGDRHGICPSSVQAQGVLSKRIEIPHLSPTVHSREKRSYHGPHGSHDQEPHTHAPSNRCQESTSSQHRSDGRIATPIRWNPSITSYRGCTSEAPSAYFATSGRAPVIKSGRLRLVRASPWSSFLIFVFCLLYFVSWFLVFGFWF